MVALGPIAVGGSTYLQCASHHLTAFLTSHSSGNVFSINAVNPVTDAGRITVGWLCLCPGVGWAGPVAAGTWAPRFLVWYLPPWRPHTNVCSCLCAFVCACT